MLGVLDGSPDRWRRYLRLVLDGMRVTDGAPLPGESAQYDTFDDVIADTKRHRHRQRPAAPASRRR